MLACLSHELIITISNVMLQNRNWLIKQIVKKIIKTRKQEIQKKILTAHRLLSNNIIVIMNTAAIKKQIKKDIS